jgi:hypothetical protein
MEAIRAGGVDHYRQRLYVHWDVTTICEYKCSYCYARKEYKQDWNRPGNWEDHQYIIDELSKSELPIFLGLLGGEPTSHQRYFQLLDLINEKVMTHPDSRLYITTNGHKKPEFYAKHGDNDGRTYFLWSLHPDYVDFDNFYANVKQMHDKGYKTKVNLMLLPARRYWDKTIEWYNKLNELEYCILHPHFIYGGFDKDVKYSKDWYKRFDFLKEQRVKEFEILDAEGNTHIMSDYEIFSQGLNQFKGWKCYHNNYEINNYGQISTQCFGDKAKPITKDFFKNIKSIDAKICPHNFCSCDGLMKIQKEK